MSKRPNELIVQKLQPTPQEIAALLEEALAWPQPLTQEQINRVLSIGPASRRIIARLNEEQTKRLYPIGARATSHDAQSKHYGRTGAIVRYYYDESPARGRYIDSLLLRFDDGKEAVPYLSHVRVENV